MKTKLNNLILQRQKTKKNLQQLKTKYLVIIYDDCIKRKTLKEIHTDLYNATINKEKVLPVEAKKLLSFANVVAKKSIKIDGDTAMLPVLLIDMFMKQAVNYKASLIINSELRDYDAREKDNIIQSSIQEGRKTGKIFYLASKHYDSALDHKPYQGKLYIDENWRSYDKDGRIAKYLQSHNLKTLQWVTGKPVYFITRPYCRHYFIQKSFDEIVNGYKAPTRKIGNRYYQTPAKASYLYYLDRYNTLKALYDKHPNAKLKNLLLKTKILKDKWYDKAN